MNKRKRVKRAKWRRGVFVICMGMCMIQLSRCAGSSGVSRSYAAEFSRNTKEDDQIVKLMEWTNEERAGNGLKILKEDQCLSAAAEMRAKELQAKFSHTRPDGTPFHTILNQFDIGGTLLGENLAIGEGGNHESVFQAWMESETHKRNVVYASYSRIGIAYVEIQGIGYWCQLFADEI